MELMYKSEKIKDPTINLVYHIRDTILNLESRNDTRDYVIKMGGVLFSVLINEIILDNTREIRGIKYFEDNTIEDNVYCIYRKDTESIKLTSVKTLNEWFANLPLIYKLDLYNSMSDTITKHLK